MNRDIRQCQLVADATANDAPNGSLGTPCDDPPHESWNLGNSVAGALSLISIDVHQPPTWIEEKIDKYYEEIANNLFLKNHPVPVEIQYDNAGGGHVICIFDARKNGKRYEYAVYDPWKFWQTEAVWKLEAFFEDYELISQGGIVSQGRSTFLYTWS